MSTQVLAPNIQSAFGEMVTGDLDVEDLQEMTCSQCQTPGRKFVKALNGQVYWRCGQCGDELTWLQHQSPVPVGPEGQPLPPDKEQEAKDLPKEPEPERPSLLRPDLQVNRWWVESNAGWCLQKIGPLPAPSELVETRMAFMRGGWSYEIVIRAGSPYGSENNLGHQMRRAMFWGPSAPQRHAMNFCSVCHEPELCSALQLIHSIPCKLEHVHCSRAAESSMTSPAGTASFAGSLRQVR